MINEYIKEIRKNIDFLYMEHSLMVKAIQVSSEMYIDIQKNIIELASRKNCVINFRNEITIEDIPVILNDSIQSLDYELVVGIPSYCFRKGVSNE